MIKDPAFLITDEFLSCRKIGIMPKKNFRILSWNVNGIRAVWKKVFGMASKDDPDVLCLQETKAQIDQLGEEIRSVNNYKSFSFLQKKRI